MLINFGIEDDLSGIPEGRFSFWPPNIDLEAVPPAQYLAACDGSLAARPVRFRTDGQGFIRTGVGFYDAPSVLVLGDSVLENYWIPESSRACARLDGQLALSGRRARVLNGCRSGATTEGLLARFMERDLRPAVVALCSGFIDCQDDAETARRPAVVRKLASAVRARGGAFVLLTSPLRSDPREPWITRRFGTPDIFAATVAPFAAVNEATRVQARAEGIRLLDLDRAFSNRPDLLYDTIHLNERGCRAVGDALFTSLGALVMTMC